MREITKSETAEPSSGRSIIQYFDGKKQRFSDVFQYHGLEGGARIRILGHHNITKVPKDTISSIEIPQ